MPKYNNPRKTWQYADEFKIRAVELSYQEGIQIQQVAEGLGIHPFMLSRWRKECSSPASTDRPPYPRRQSTAPQPSAGGHPGYIRTSS